MHPKITFKYFKYLWIRQQRVGGQSQSFIFGKSVYSRRQSFQAYMVCEFYSSFREKTYDLLLMPFYVKIAFFKNFDSILESCMRYLFFWEFKHF